MRFPLGLNRLFPRGVPVPPPRDPQAEALEMAIRSDGSEEARQFSAWLQEAGVSLARDADPREVARNLLDALEARAERIRRELRVAQEVAVKAGGGESGAARSMIRRREVELEQIDAAIDKLWPKLHPPLVRGEQSGFPTSVTRCKWPSCGREIDAQEAFKQFGSCSECFAAETAGPDQTKGGEEALDALDALVQAL